MLKNIAEELGLDVEKEYDLVSLAQYCYNKNGNRSIINDVIYEEFSKEKKIDENHRILARLPIFTYWTTNYDSLIEDALKENQRIVDVKYHNKHLSVTKPHRDAVVYKMHGDVSNPDETILIKDDYKKYYLPLMVIILIAVYIMRNYWIKISVLQYKTFKAIQTKLFQ